MIINVRGTNGSGKSTLVKAVMARYPGRLAGYEPARRRPTGYLCTRPAGRDLYVPGHYETPCGGCDTLKSPAQAFAAIETAAKDNRDVLFEGIIVQDDVTRLAALAAVYSVLVIGLQVSAEECLYSIKARRDARADARPLDPTNTVNRIKSVTRSMERLAEAGVNAYWASREVALASLLEVLRLPAVPVAAAEEEFKLC